MEGKCIGFFGPTGSGKTTELNRIAKELITKNETVSYVFQDNQLIENLSVLKNVILPLENKGLNEDTELTALKWIENFKLHGKEEQLCGTLSGGEKQRVGVARAFAYNGNTFLLDEPFSAQDDENKMIIMQYIKSAVSGGKTVYLVSHNKEDLEQLCNEIIYFPQKA